MARLIKLTVLLFVVMAAMGSPSREAPAPLNALEVCGPQAAACTVYGDGEAMVYTRDELGFADETWMEILTEMAVSVVTASVAEAHHTGVPCGAASDLPTGDARCLPQMDRSWAVDQLRADLRLTWCMNYRASTYPNLRAQIREVLANHEAALGIDWIEIPGTYETPTAAMNAGCQVQHNMPTVHGCQECGGWIHYLNRPVLIEYNPHRGITLFQTTISHEVIHLYGVHEHYDDANFRSHRNTYGYWAHGLTRSPGTFTDAPTTMDFGTGVWRMTAYDVKYTCQSIDRQGVIFSGCRPAPPPCGVIATDPRYGSVFDTCIIKGPHVGAWRWPDGGLYVPGNAFFYPTPHETWGDCDPNWNGCYNFTTGFWVGPTGDVFDPATGQFTAHRSETPWGGYFNQAWIASDGAVYTGSVWARHPFR